MDGKSMLIMIDKPNHTSSYIEEMPTGKFQVPVALIVGKGTVSSNLKTFLNDTLKEYNIAI